MKKNSTTIVFLISMARDNTYTLSMDSWHLYNHIRHIMVHTLFDTKLEEYNIHLGL